MQHKETLIKELKRMEAKFLAEKDTLHREMQQIDGQIQQQQA